MNDKANKAVAETSVKDVTSLRSTLEWFRTKGYLIETDKEVNPDLEITGLQKIFDGSLPMLFNNVKGMPYARAITNLFGDIRIVEDMFGWESSLDRVKKVARAIDHPLKPIIIEQEDAPVQEDVITENIDVNKWLTAIKHTPLETELTIGARQGSCRLIHAANC
ncbi:MAG: UbiD family decarboxylase [Polaromonas sp.]|nr:UbiD family decarboxylase [Polaromonas sp.]